VDKKRLYLPCKRLRMGGGRVIAGSPRSPATEPFRGKFGHCRYACGNHKEGE
jgi:hypothetical protein